MSPEQFRSLFLALANVDRWTLEDVGLIPKGPLGDGKWKRFNSDLTTFVLKLNADQTAVLMALVLPEGQIKP